MIVDTTNMATTLQPRPNLASKHPNRPKRIFHHTHKRLHLANKIATSHRLARELRNVYGLPPITEKQESAVIRGINGIARDYADDEESSVDAIKAARDRIY